MTPESWQRGRRRQRSGWMMSGVISRWHCGLEFGVLRPRRSLPGDLQCPGVYQTRRSNNKHFTTTSNHFIAIGEQNHSINQIHKFDYNSINLLPSYTKEERKKYTKKKSGYQKKQELIKRPRTFILNLIHIVSSCAKGFAYRLQRSAFAGRRAVRPTLGSHRVRQAGACNDGDYERHGEVAA